MSADGLTPARVVDTCAAADAATCSPGSSLIEIGRVVCREMLDYMKDHMQKQM